MSRSAFAAALATAILGMVSACRPTRPAAGPPAARAVPQGPEESISVAARAHDAIARPLGVPPLRLTRLPPGARELRLSTGQGMVSGWEYPLVRLLRRDGRTTGEIWLYRSVLDSSVAPPVGRVETRRAVPRAPVDWRALDRRLAELGVDTLSLPTFGRGAVDDGGELYVEVRAGGAYRAYWVNAPEGRARSEPAVGPAAAIAALVDSLGRTAGAH